MTSLDPTFAAATPASVPSDQVTPASPDDAALAAAPGEEQIDAENLSLTRRLRQWRTLVSIGLPIVLLLLIVRNLPGFQLERVPGLIASANGWLLLVAFVVFYAGFPLRGLRWTILLRGTGIRVGVRDGTEIIFLSWLVNCIVPAKLGDVYRAYLLKINSPVSLSRTFGTVFIERIFDLFAIAILGLAAGFWSFRTNLPPEIQVVFGIAVGVIVVLAVMLFTLRNFGRRILSALPFPHRVVELYDRFEEGVFGAIGARQVPVLAAITVLIWVTEGMRLFFVVQALGFPDVALGISGAFFVAFVGSLLTAVPLSPAGIGVVETGIVAVLTLAYGVPVTEAAAIALVDRAISVFSIIILGSIAYLISPLRRGAGLAHSPQASVLPAEPAG